MLANEPDQMLLTNPKLQPFRRCPESNEGTDEKKKKKTQGGGKGKVRSTQEADRCPMDRETNVCFGCAGPSCSLPDATPVGMFHFRFFLHIPFEIISGGLDEEVMKDHERFLPRNGIVEARSSPQFRILSPSDLLCANRKGEIFSLVFSCSRLFKLASCLVVEKIRHQIPPLWVSWVENRMGRTRRCPSRSPQASLRHLANAVGCFILFEGDLVFSDTVGRSSQLLKRCCCEVWYASHFLSVCQPVAVQTDA